MRWTNDGGSGFCLEWADKSNDFLTVFPLFFLLTHLALIYFTPLPRLLIRFKIANDEPTFKSYYPFVISFVICICRCCRRFWFVVGEEWFF